MTVKMFPGSGAGVKVAVAIRVAAVASERAARSRVVVRARMRIFHLLHWSVCPPRERQGSSGIEVLRDRGRCKRQAPARSDPAGALSISAVARDRDQKGTAVTCRFENRQPTGGK